MLELTHISPALEQLDQLQSAYTMKLWNSQMDKLDLHTRGISLFKKWGNETISKIVNKEWRLKW